MGAGSSLAMINFIVLSRLIEPAICMAVSTPLKTETLVPSYKEYDPLSKGSEDNRFTEILEFYENALCEGTGKPAKFVKRDTCYTVTDKNIQSARIITYWGQSYFDIYERGCDISPIKRRVFQNEEEPTDCYNMTTGNSFKWDWRAWYM